MEEYKEKKLVSGRPSFTQRSAEYYRAIKSITFRPKKLEYTYGKPDVKKGEVWWWKLFGKIPVIPCVAEEDLYKYRSKLHDEIRRFTTKESHFNTYYSFGEYFMLDGDNVYRKATVEVELDKKIYDRYEVEAFTSNEEAISYFDHIEGMCKKFGNHLKNNSEKS